MIISRTPFRISFLGGGTDYPEWIAKHGGMVVGTTINQYAYVTARVLPPYHPHKHRLIYHKIELPRTHLEIQHRAIRATLECLGADRPEGPGLEIAYMGDVPARSGMGSSSAFVVGLVHALSRLGTSGQLLASWYADTPYALSRTAIEIEQTRLGETVGCQDQLFAAHGGLKAFTFHKEGNVVVEHLNLPAYEIESLERYLLLFFTGINRTASSVASSYVPSLTLREAQLKAVLRHAQEGRDVLLAGEWSRLGQLMEDSWYIKRGLSCRVSNGVIDQAYTDAKTAGAWGGKLLGAGGGGCLCFVAPPERHDRIRRALRELVEIRFRIEPNGSSIIFPVAKETVPCTRLAS